MPQQKDSIDPLWKFLPPPSQGTGPICLTNCHTIASLVPHLCFRSLRLNLRGREKHGNRKETTNTTGLFFKNFFYWFFSIIRLFLASEESIFSKVRSGLWKMLLPIFYQLHPGVTGLQSLMFFKVIWSSFSRVESPQERRVCISFIHLFVHSFAYLIIHHCKINNSQY